MSRKSERKAKRNAMISAAQKTNADRISNATATGTPQTKTTGTNHPGSADNSSQNFRSTGASDCK